MKVRGTDQKEHNLKPEQNLMKVRGTELSVSPTFIYPVRQIIREYDGPTK